MANWGDNVPPIRSRETHIMDGRSLNSMAGKHHWSMRMIWFFGVLFVCMLWLTGGGAGKTITVDDDGGAD
jgi:hypothetical protein